MESESSILTEAHGYRILKNQSLFHSMKHMKTTTLFFAFVIFTVSLFGQSTPQKYPDLIRIADSLYNGKDFKNSAFAFSDAISTGSPNSKL